jgi:succinoglycan biosynthesis transport protein ExoP
MAEGKTTDFDLKLYWSILLRRKYVALGVALAVLSVFTWGSFFMSKTYEASSTVMIEKSSIIDPLIQGVGVGGLSEGISNVRDSVTSRNLLEKVMEKTGNIAIMKNPGRFDEYLKNVRKDIQVKASGGYGRAPELFTISYRGGDPVKIRDFVNALVKEYIAENVSSRVTDATDAYDFIQTQLLEYKSKLEESDRGIREFRERNPNMIPQSETVLTGRLETFQSAKIDADIKLKELLRKRDNLQKQLSGEKQLTVAFVTREGSPQARLNALMGQLSILRAKYTDSYPEVVRIKREIDELRIQIAEAKDMPSDHAGSETAALNPIYQQLKEEYAKTDAEIESLRARSAELARQRQEAQSILGRMPKEQEEWTKLQRDRNVYQKIYDELLQKLESARVTKDLGENTKYGAFRIVDPAITPPLPIKPNRVRMILMGIVLGLAAGIGSVFGLEYLDRSFRDETSIENVLKLSVLSTIPKIMTEDDEHSVRARDKKIFTLAGAYLVVILIVFAAEFLHRYIGVKVINF